LEALLSFSLAMMAVGIVIFAVAQAAESRRSAALRCPKCGYAMSAAAGFRCAECGHVAWNVDELRPSRRRPGSWIGFAIMVLGWAGATIAAH
jgi:predicted RNA-binding Zn-ribbon protein involved in translation (DUF1610 family)